MLALRVFDQPVRMADAMVCLTPEELELVERRFRFTPNASVIGIGLEPDVTSEPGRFRESFGLGERRYIVFVGRVDPGKGSDELARMFVAYKERRPSDLALVIVGEPVTRPEPHPDIVMTGFVDEQTKLDAVGGAELLVQPSYFESFSLSLCEGWLAEKPAIVQGRCAVLAGQSARSGGGLPYRSFAEFAATLDRLLDDEPLRRAMGQAGRRYVVEQYQWPHVLDEWERVLQHVVTTSTPRIPASRSL
jgi:glycosyltransferase involved in cell wall biosynthesis